MLGNLPNEKSGIISKEHVCEGKQSPMNLFLSLATIIDMRGSLGLKNYQW